MIQPVSTPPTAARAPRWSLVVATGLGSGYSPVAPGTAGTALCAILMWLARAWLSPVVDAALVVVLVAAGIPAASRVARAIGRKDPGLVVIDEFAGYAISLAFLPKTAPWFLAAFFLFRLLDVWKPPPCRRLERLEGGLGIVADDVMAGLYVNVCLQAARLLITMTP